MDKLNREKDTLQGLEDELSHKRETLDKVQRQADMTEEWVRECGHLINDFVNNKVLSLLTYSSMLKL